MRSGKVFQAVQPGHLRSPQTVDIFYLLAYSNTAFHIFNIKFRKKFCFSCPISLKNWQVKYLIVTDLYA